MKKLLLIGFALILSFLSINTKAQSIQSVTITSPILCYGDLANINIQINQSTPPVLYKVIVGYYPIPGLFVSAASTKGKIPSG